MQSSPIEIKYPISFRADEAKTLGEHLKLRHSVEIIGAKRVGISDFLRFFLFRQGVVQKYIDKKSFHLFIAIDLNDLVEREIYPFWILVLKRINDAVDDARVDEKLHRDISVLFTSSIQSNDLFLTIENVRTAIKKIVESDILPTIFFIRFERIINVTGADFYSNLESLIDVSAHKLAYVFTSFRNVDEISLEELPRNFLHVFSNIMFIRPAKVEDSKIIFNAFKKRYSIKPKGQVEKKIIELCGGHVQYLHLLILFIVQTERARKLANGELLEVAAIDERIYLQSEEIWESLKPVEQKVLTKYFLGEKVTKEEKANARYLFDTGIVDDVELRERVLMISLRKKEKARTKHIFEIFSPLFSKFLAGKARRRLNGEIVDLSKKENSLFNLLAGRLDEVCERELIIESVWPEAEELGVSDWTVDRLVARLREKLKKRGDEYQIITVKTRGFKLVKN